MEFRGEYVFVVGELVNGRYSRLCFCYNVDKKRYLTVMEGGEYQYREFVLSFAKHFDDGWDGYCDLLEAFGFKKRPTDKEKKRAWKTLNEALKDYPADTEEEEEE